MVVLDSPNPTPNLVTSYPQDVYSQGGPTSSPSYSILSQKKGAIIYNLMKNMDLISNEKAALMALHSG